MLTICLNCKVHLIGRAMNNSYKDKGSVKLVYYTEIIQCKIHNLNLSLD